MPALEAALGKILMLPERKLDRITANLERFPEVKRVMIDGTERKARRTKDSSRQTLRSIQRPIDPKQQTLNYSGKKKQHTRKHLAGVDETKRVNSVKQGTRG